MVDRLACDSEYIRDWITENTSRKHNEKFCEINMHQVFYTPAVHKNIQRKLYGKLIEKAFKKREPALQQGLTHCVWHRRHKLG